jgi:hypothetical protein
MGGAIYTARRPAVRTSRPKPRFLGQRKIDSPAQGFLELARREAMAVASARFFASFGPGVFVTSYITESTTNPL